MSPTLQRLVPLAFALAGLLFLFVAFKPTATAQAIHFPYLVLAIAFFLLGFAVLPGSGQGGSS